MTNETTFNNGNGNGNGNGHLHGGVGHETDSDSIFLDDGPEVLVESSAAAGTDDERRPQLVRDEGNIAEGMDTERGARPARGRRRVAGAAFVLIVMFVGGVVAYFMFGGGTRKAKVSVNSNRASAQDSDEALTKQAIEQIKTPGGITLADGTVLRPQPSPVDPQQQQQLTQGPTEPVTQLPSNLSATVSPTPTGPVVVDAQQQSQQSSTISKLAGTGGRNNERSLWLGEDAAALEKQPRQPERVAQESTVPGVVVPPFGSMLPVRSLGAIYTLRSGGLARFELTRDVKGKGWFLPHGTVLVGALRGAEFDRAFISLIGFIDSESGKFVKITGDVLGSDGGAGVRGKRRKMSSSWTKVLAKLGEAGLNIAGGVASSVGRRPVIVSDAFGSVGYRVTNEFDGVLLNKDKNVFVEVPAGTSCYMMITQLPDSVQGVDALAKFSGREVEDRADSDRPRSSTGLSESELAELMQSGDPERVRAALPRMTPEMRKVAEAVLSQGGDR